MRTTPLLLLAAFCVIGCGRSSERPTAPIRTPAAVSAAATVRTDAPAPAAAPAPASRLRLRDLTWGDPVPTGFRLLSQQSKSESAYFDPKEKLSIEGVAVLDISYRFIDGRFSAMAVQGTPANYPALAAALKKKWGPPLEEDPGRVKWKDAETTALAGLAESSKPFVLIVIDNATVERARTNP